MMAYMMSNTSTENHNAKSLCLRIIEADNESKVKEILEEEGMWSNEEYWSPYGESMNNFSDIGNQQSGSLDALIEKFTNSIDATIMKEVQRDGVDPKSDEAPDSIREAVNDYFDIPGGLLRNLSSKERNDLAKELIAFVASGEKGRNSKKPTYSVIDRGEGQHPDNFSKTLLSLGESNKLEVPFVQGEFNMGGTGVLPFCGEYGTQFILSRRDPEISDEDSNPWGFTIVRRFDVRELEGDYAHPVYMYLTLDGDIPRFKEDELPLWPSEESEPNQREEELTHGTYIKMYNFDTPTTTMITLDPKYRLSGILTKPPLPIRFYETRDYSGHSLTSTLSGLDVRLFDDRSENVVDGFPSTSGFQIGNSDFKVRTYCIKRQDDKRNVKRYRQAKDGIIFTINGQVHASKHERFFTRKKVGLNYIKDSIIVIVDCSEMASDDRADFFMNSRDRLRDTDIRTKIEDKLESILGSHEGLNSVIEERKEDALENQLEENSSLADAFEQVAEGDGPLSQIFKSGDIGQGQKDSPDPPEPPEPPDYLKKYPTKFNPKNEVFEISENKENISLKFDTDAENDYFKRDKNPGKVIIILRDGTSNIDNYSRRIWNGNATIRIHTEDNGIELEQGDEYEFTVIVDDGKSRNETPFTHHLEAHITEEEEPEPEPEPEPLGGLPSIEMVGEDEWDDKEDFDFTENEAMFVTWRGEDEGYHFLINTGNQYLKDFVSSSDQRAERVRLKFAYALVILASSILEKYSDDGENGRVNTPEEKPTIEEIINNQARLQAKVILPMLDSVDELDKV